MAAHTTNEYKNEKRRHGRSLIREGMFISDFVNTKYKCIYQEASALYNEINQINPRKPDLRRTKEYRQWKNNIASAHNLPLTPIPREKKRKLVHMTHRNIPISTTSHSTIICVDIPTVENPATDNQIPPESPPAEIPLPACQTPQQSGSPRPESPLSDDQTSSENPTLDKRISGMTMQLNIPLIQCPTISKTIQDPEEIQGSAYIETILSEGNQSEMLDPSLLDEVSPEVLEKIIKDLQQDPNLKNIMTDIENQTNIEEELVGLNIDIPDLYDPLEEELQSIFG